MQTEGLKRERENRMSYKLSLAACSKKLSLQPLSCYLFSDDSVLFVVLRFCFILVINTWSLILILIFHAGGTASSPTEPFVMPWQKRVREP